MLIFRFCFIKMEESKSYEVKKKIYTFTFAAIHIHLSIEWPK